jgi:beta propeller repeat protein
LNEKIVIILIGLFFALLFCGAVNAASDLKFTSISTNQNGNIIEIKHSVKNQGNTASNSPKIEYNLRKAEEALVKDSGHQLNLDIYGDNIVYQDNSRNGNWDIWLYNSKTNNKKQITSSLRDEINPAISKNKVVYEVVNSNSNHDIILYNIDTNIYMDISTNPNFYESHPDIDGNDVVWQSNSGNPYGTTQIWKWNINSDKMYKKTIDMHQEINVIGDSTNPSITGNRVAFQFYGHNFIPDNSPGPNWDIYMYDFSNNKLICVCSALGNQANPKINKSGNAFVWEDDRNGNWDIYYNGLNKDQQGNIIIKNQQGFIVCNLASRQTHPDFDESYVVWEDNRNQNYDIYRKYIGDLGDGTRITYNNANQYGPKIYENHIIWVDARNGEINNLDIYKTDVYGPYYKDYPLIEAGQTKNLYNTINQFFIYDVIAKCNHYYSLSSLEWGKYYIDAFIKYGNLNESNTSNNGISSAPFTIEYTYPKVKTITPANNASNIKGFQVITITFTENIKSGSNYSLIALKNSSGTPIPFTTNIYKNILTLTQKNLYYKGTKYYITLPYKSITDIYGNILLDTFKSCFTVESVPPKLVSTTPTNLKIGYSRTADITIKFNELIKSSSNFNNITVKNLTTNKNIAFTKIFFYENIIITTSTRAAYNWYQVTIPINAIKDWAGNQLTTTYSFKFRTGV